MSSYRLDRWMVMLGISTRKEAGNLIKKGAATSPNHDKLKSDTKLSEGETLLVNRIEYTLQEFVYYMMNKPSGVLSASRDNRSETVIDLLPDEYKRPELFPAGRLDKDTEGFVIITNDGKFSHKILTPKNKVPKTYIARLDDDFDHDYLIDEFAKGIDIGEGEVASPAQLRIVEDGQKPTVELIIYEGKFHQVKRMFARYGLEVEYLKRVQIGGLTLDEELELGESRIITNEELEQI